MEYSLTGLRDGLADEFAGFLYEYNGGMKNVVDLLQNIADIFDEHERNNFSVGTISAIKNFYESIVDSLNVLNDVTLNCVRELEKKNESLGSGRLEEDMRTLRIAADRLSDGIEYDSPALNGNKNFTDDESSLMVDEMLKMADRWQEYYDGLIVKAKTFSDEEEQNEMSKVYESVILNLNKIEEACESCISGIIIQNDDIAELFRQRKTKADADAEEISKRVAERNSDILESDGNILAQFVF